MVTSYLNSQKHKDLGYLTAILNILNSLIVLNFGQINAISSVVSAIVDVILKEKEKIVPNPVLVHYTYLAYVALKMEGSESAAKLWPFFDEAAKKKLITYWKVTKLDAVSKTEETIISHIKDKSIPDLGLHSVKVYPHQVPTPNGNFYVINNFDNIDKEFEQKSLELTESSLVVPYKPDYLLEEGIWIEINGPQHYIRHLDAGIKQNAYSLEGFSAFKHEFVKRLGFTYLEIPFYRTKDSAERFAHNQLAEAKSKLSKGT
eukprot:TRINITY_DN6821_c0_g1_i1.p1 TRINITY_DN6821_c0_g1~~TRINITY_DN6821_c0_g1_i1.p1  ORF type:complete len:260 (+),score=62.76 TRINITY_DN6821_c0_g1_i1:278-1057(+)